MTRFLSFLSGLLLLLMCFLELHDRDVDLLENDAVSVLLKVLGGVNDHVDLFH